MKNWLNKAVFSIAISAVFLCSPIAFAYATSLHFSPAVNNNWGNANNWFLDAGFTVPAGGTPGVSDTAYVHGSVSTALVSSIEINTLHVLAGTLSGSATFDVVDTAYFYDRSGNNTALTADHIYFSDWATNSAPISAQTVEFSDDSINTSVITSDHVEFIDYTENQTGADINGSAFFRNSAKNNGSADALFFYDSAENLSSGVAPTGEFHGYSKNSSNALLSLSESAQFYDRSDNAGHVAGNAYFDCLATNNGVVDGEISYSSCDYYFHGNNTNWSDVSNWWLDSDFTIPALRLPTSTDFAHIYSDVSIADAVYVNTLRVFGTSTVQGGSFHLGSYALFQDYSRLLPGTELWASAGSLNFDNHSSAAQMIGHASAFFFNDDSELDNAPNSSSTLSVTYSEIGCHSYINEATPLTGRAFRPCVKSPLNGSFGIGDTVPLHVYFNRNPNFLVSTAAGQIPTLKIDTGDSTVDLPCTNCTTATTTWVFNYTVAEGDFSDDLSYYEPASLDTSGMTRSSNVGSGPLSFNWLPEFEERGSLMYENDIVIDGIVPTISSIASTTGPTSATITWTTSEAASSSVQYGLSNLYGSVSATSSGTLSHSVTLSGLTPSTTYHFAISAFDRVQNSTTTSDYEFNTTAAPVSEPSSSGGIGYSVTYIAPPVIPAQRKLPQVSTTTAALPQDQDLPTICEPYLTSFMSINQNNDAQEVKKLKQFLNNYEGEVLAVNGVFDTATLEAVKRFQIKNASTLSFWGLSKPTGFVYISTINRINTIVCQNKTGTACPYFTSSDYIGPHDQGASVYKVAQFLNSTQGEHISLPFNKNEMIFTGDILSAIKRFQLKNAAKVLSPWGLTQPSGLWYQSTSKAANDTLGCFIPLRLDNGRVLN